MKDQLKTKKELLEENAFLKQKIHELKHVESERKWTEDQILVANERLQFLLSSTSAVIYAAKPSGEYGATFISENVARMVGYNPEEFIRDSNLWFDNVHPEDQTIISEEVPKIFEKELHTYEYRFRCKDGRYIWISDQMKLIRDNDGNPIEIIGFWLDITDRKRMEAEILALSLTDQLTGLYNRRGFLSLAGQQLKLSERNKSGLLLYFADLDLLKWINDELGHEEGDKALNETANIFKETFRTSDIIARLGGDEFAVLAIDIKGTNPEVFTARMQQLIDIWNNLENRKYKLSISMGCAYYDPENPVPLTI